MNRRNRLQKNTWSDWVLQQQIEDSRAFRSRNLQPRQPCKKMRFSSRRTEKKDGMESSGVEHGSLGSSKLYMKRRLDVFRYRGRTASLNEGLIRSINGFENGRKRNLSVKWEMEYTREHRVAPMLREASWHVWRGKVMGKRNKERLGPSV